MGNTPEYTNPEHQALEEHVAVLLDSYEHMTPDQVVDTYRLHLSIDDDHLEAMARLPARNLSLGAEVYRRFAESTEPQDRKEILMYLPRLCLADRAAGLELWDHLVRDTNDDVRHAAFDELDGERLGSPSLDSAHQQQEEEYRRATLGLTWQDIAHLYRAHLQAERWPSERYEPAPPSGAQPSS